MAEHSEHTHEIARRADERIAKLFADKATKQDMLNAILWFVTALNALLAIVQLIQIIGRI